MAQCRCSFWCLAPGKDVSNLRDAFRQFVQFSSSSKRHKLEVRYFALMDTLKQFIRVLAGLYKTNTQLAKGKIFMSKTIFFYFQQIFINCLIANWNLTHGKLIYLCLCKIQFNKLIREDCTAVPVSSNNLRDSKTSHHCQEKFVLIKSNNRSSSTIDLILIF